MPSTLVHAALAGLLAAALLGRTFGPRTVALVVGLVVLVDFDVFVGWVVLGAHRSAFHTLLWPALATAALALDLRRGSESALVERFGPQAPRVAVTCVAGVVFAGIGPDLVTNGANVFYPVHDQFYAFDGAVRYSTRDGIVQTFVEGGESASKGSSEEVQFRTGADPQPDRTGADTGGTGEEPPPERVFLIVDSGLQALLVVTGTLVVAGRLAADRLDPRTGGD